MRVIDAAAPLAFCAGWLRPRVYVSTAVLDRLSDAELRAVLAHEQHHGALRDPLRLAVGRVLCQALFFLPVLRPLHDRYADVAELTADAAALAAVGRRDRAARLGDARVRDDAGRRGGRDLARARRRRCSASRRAWRLPRLLLVAALATLGAPSSRSSGARAARASVQATLNLPIASSQPCVLVLALVPVLACLAARSPAPGARAVPLHARADRRGPRRDDRGAVRRRRRRAWLHIYYVS